ncbi:MAG: acyl-CoA thioesterase [Candidatus Omnitrophica bacterium]|nr:acyl-CoA thioesterase [Candidatus Omnitrophota bacterium]
MNQDSILEFRVRYADTDKMGGIYHSRVLEWFEMGRTELFRKKGTPYTEVESRGVFLPIVEAHVQYKHRACYDDLLRLSADSRMHGKARIQCSHLIVHAHSGEAVAQGYTIHACVDSGGKVIRPPRWLVELIQS